MPLLMLSNPQLYSDFAAFCGRNPSSAGRSLLGAFTDCKKARADFEMGHKHLVLELGLNWKSAKQQIARDEHLASLGAPVMCERLKTPYPPMGM